MKHISYKNISWISSLLLAGVTLSACGGGGSNSNNSPNDSPQDSMSAQLNLSTEIPEAFVSSEQAILTFSLAVNQAKAFKLAANNQSVMIKNRYFHPAIKDIDLAPVSAENPCQLNKAYISGQSCQDIYILSPLKEEITYNGELIYETTIGSVKSPVTIHFKPESHEVFDKNPLGIMSVPHLIPGSKSKIVLSNASSNAILYPYIAFPDVIAPFIESIYAPKEIKPLSEATLSFSVQSTPEALNALKKWHSDLLSGEQSDRIKIKSATTRSKDLTAIKLSTSAVSLTNQNYVFQQSDDKIVVQFGIKNMTDQSLEKVFAELQNSDLNDYITILSDDTSISLNTNESIQLKLAIDPSLPASLLDNGNIDIHFHTGHDVDHLESAVLSLPLDLTPTASLDSERSALNALLANQTNHIKISNAGLFDWHLPSLNDVEIIDSNGVALPLNQIKVMESSPCLQKQILQPKEQCDLILEVNNISEETYPQPYQLLISV